MNFTDTSGFRYKKLFLEFIKNACIQKLKEKNIEFDPQVSLTMSYVEPGLTRIYYGEGSKEPLIDVSTEAFSEEFYIYVKGLEG